MHQKRYLLLKPAFRYASFMLREFVRSKKVSGFSTVLECFHIVFLLACP